MPATIPNTFTGAATLNAAQLDTNFSSLASYTAAIPGTDLQSGSIPNAQLTNAFYDFSVNLQFTNPATTSIAALSTVLPCALYGLPELATATSYSVTSASYCCTNAGTAGSCQFHVEYGYFLANAWTSLIGGSAYIIAATTLTGGGGTVRVSGTPTITTTAIPGASGVTTKGFLALFITGTIDASFLNTMGNCLSVSLNLKRTGGLRS